ncbi:uncharacterized protein LOC117654209 [Thrips palmi]|uniref:Uncharacterized protein LOC117654209 n=1 Tax=Thrips palmi TaxID=161013 RepID=A0A6P9ADN1_THRPL|nr:uncharacterized protein LOC117654209 [Thrips palmi]
MERVLTGSEDLLSKMKSCQQFSKFNHSFATPRMITMHQKLVPMIALLVLLVTPVARCRFINAYAGPYISYADRVFECSDDGPKAQLQVHLRFSHFNRFKPYEKQTATGNVTLLQDVDDSHSEHSTFITKKVLPHAAHWH